MAPLTEREIEIFNAAWELPAAERPAYVREACGDDDALRQRIEDLLRVSEAAGAYFESPVVRVPKSDETKAESQTPVAGTGEQVGPYKLVELLGEGGCGVVYLAEQEQPVRRHVALKVIKLGMDTKSVMARFEAEQFQNRAHFFGAAAETMRRILIDKARRKRAQRHGGDLHRMDADDIQIAAPEDDDKMLAVNDALDKLAATNALQAKVVKLHYFVGMTNDEVAQALALSVRTVRSYWSHARAWLFQEITATHARE